MLNKDSRIALYYQLMDIILNDIEVGNLKENTKLPSERDFCEKFKISRATVRQAIAELEKNKIIYKIQGKGTFIAPKKLDQPLIKFYSFTEEMIKLGKNPTSQILDFSIINCDERISNTLNLDILSKVYKLVRIRLIDNLPTMYETTYLPTSIFPNLTLDILKEKPLYTILKENYNIKFLKAEETFFPILATEEEATFLNVSTYDPSIKIQRVTFSSEYIIEFTESIVRGEKFKYKVILDADNSTF